MGGKKVKYLSEELICEFRISSKDLRKELLGVFLLWTFCIIVDCASRRPCRLLSRHFIRPCHFVRAFKQTNLKKSSWDKKTGEENWRGNRESYLPPELVLVLAIFCTKKCVWCGVAMKKKT